MTAPEHTAAGAAAADEDRRFPHWRRNRKALPFANLLCNTGFHMTWPFLPLMMRSLGVNEHLETWMGWMMLAFYIVGFTCAPIWGSIADHYGRKIMLLRAMLGMGFFMLLVPLAPSPWWFAALFTLVGLFNGFHPAGMSLLVANTPPGRMGNVMSLAQMGSLIGATAGPAVGGAAAAIFDQRHWMFWISGGMMLSGGMLVLAFVREVRTPRAGPWRPQWLGSLRELLAVPGMGLLFLLSFLFSMLWNGNVTTLSIYTLQLLAAQPPGSGSEAFWVSTVAMALAISSLLAIPLWGRAIDRYPPAHLLSVATAAAALTTLPLVFVQTPLQLVLARVAFGLGAVGLQTIIIRVIKDYAPEGMDARAIAYSSSFHLIGMGVTPFVAGLIGPALGLRAHYVLCVLCTLGGLALWMRRPARR